jgi:hypothetical protein
VAELGFPSKLKIQDPLLYTCIEPGEGDLLFPGCSEHFIMDTCLLFKKLCVEKINLNVVLKN